ncbi:hypothetical protein [Micromonospora sp. NPDC049374]|uniref:hypothetical protein n=1 Tax=Micromonospora sp. NPDC049374 TaxID=3154352 RepID=UPI00342FBD1A
MVRPPASTSRLRVERGVTAVEGRCDRLLALLRACGLRFRDGSRWRPPVMVQLHL